MRQAIAGGLVTLLLMLGCGVPAVSAGPTPDRSLPAQATPQVEVHLDTVVPSTLGPGRTWGVRGQVENLSDVTVQVEEVRLSTAFRALDTRVALGGWVSGDEDLNTPRLIASDELSGALEPGASQTFLIVVPADALKPPFAATSLPLRIEAMSGGNAVAQLRTVLPWYAGTSADRQLALSWVVPLTVPPVPDLLAEQGPARTQAWLDVVGEAAPARVWLDVLSEYAGTFVVDPALLVPVGAADIAEGADEELPLPESEDPASTAESPTPSAAPTDPGTSTADPSDADPTASQPALPDVDLPEDLTSLQQAEVTLQDGLGALGRDRLWWLPLSDPDVTALQAIGADAQLIQRLISAPLPPSALSADVLVERGRHDIAWPISPVLRDEELRALKDAWSDEDVATAMVPRSAFEDSTGVNSMAYGTRSLDGDNIALLGFDETMSQLIADMPSPDRDGAHIQLLLAHSLARYQRSPAAPGSLVLAPPRGSSLQEASVRDLAQAYEEAPWVEQVAAADLFDETGMLSLTGTPAVPEPGDSPLTGSQIERIEELWLTLEDLQTIVAPGGAAQQWGQIIQGLYSTRWRDNPEQWSLPLRDMESQVQDIVDGVQINPTTVNFLADEGLIQITVVNDLPIAVRNVQLELSPGNGRLRIIEQPPDITIGPESRATVQFRARAIAAGQVPVRATLSTPGGLAIGEEQEVSVQVRPTGIWIYWVLGAVAGVILILGLARALRPRPPSSASSAAR